MHPLRMTEITYFVDEAGDTTLFGRYGKVLANTDAVSRFFMVARLEVDDIEALQVEMDELRAELLAAPLLKAEPSMQAVVGKTALFFHADNIDEGFRSGCSRVQNQREAGAR